MDFNTIKDQSNMLFKELHNTHVKFYELWVGNIIFTWRWWIAMSLIISPWVIWLLVRKKESTDRLLYAGFFIMVVSSALDMIGIALNLWSYPINVFPLMPEFIPFDICALPVGTMLFIQFFPKIKPWIKSFIYATVASFIFQPIMSWFGLYNKMDWHDYYSFPILVVLYLIADHLASKKNFAELK